MLTLFWTKIDFVPFLDQCDLTPPLPGPLGGFVGQLAQVILVESPFKLT